MELVEVIGGGVAFQFAQGFCSNTSGRVDAVARGGACTRPTQGHSQMLPLGRASSYTHILVLFYPWVWHLASRVAECARCCVVDIVVASKSVWSPGGAQLSDAVPRDRLSPSPLFCIDMPYITFAG